MRGGLGNILQQAQKMQEELQKQMAQAQKELESAEVLGSAGGNMVVVTMSGRRYTLAGPPGHDPDGEHVFLSKFGSVLKLCHLSIVSDQYARPVVTE